MTRTHQTVSAAVSVSNGICNGVCQTTMFWKPAILGSCETRLVDPKLKVSKTCLIGALESFENGLKIITRG